MPHPLDPYRQRIEALQASMPQLPLGLIEAIIMQESGGNPSAIGDQGRAHGLGQVWPGTASGLGHDPEQRLNPDANLEMVGALLRELGGVYDWDPIKMIVGYNQGQTKLDRLGLEGVPDSAIQYAQEVVDRLPGDIPASQAPQQIPPQISPTNSTPPPRPGLLEDVPMDTSRYPVSESMPLQEYPAPPPEPEPSWFEQSGPGQTFADLGMTGLGRAADRLIHFGAMPLRGMHEYNRAIASALGGPEIPEFPDTAAMAQQAADVVPGNPRGDVVKQFGGDQPAWQGLAAILETAMLDPDLAYGLGAGVTALPGAMRGLSGAGRAIAGEVRGSAGIGVPKPKLPPGAMTRPLKDAARGALDRSTLGVSRRIREGNLNRKIEGYRQKGAEEYAAAKKQYRKDQKASAKAEKEATEIFAKEEAEIMAPYRKKRIQARKKYDEGVLRREKARQDIERQETADWWRRGNKTIAEKRAAQKAAEQRRLNRNKRARERRAEQKAAAKEQKERMARIEREKKAREMGAVRPGYKELNIQRTAMRKEEALQELRNKVMAHRDAMRAQGRKGYEGPQGYERSIEDLRVRHELKRILALPDNAMYISNARIGTPKVGKANVDDIPVTPKSATRLPTGEKTFRQIEQEARQGVEVPDTLLRRWEQPTGAGRVTPLERQRFEPRAEPPEGQQALFDMSPPPSPQEPTSGLHARKPVTADEYLMWLGERSDSSVIGALVNKAKRTGGRARMSNYFIQKVADELISLAKTNQSAFMRAMEDVKQSMGHREWKELMGNLAGAGYRPGR